MSEWWWKWVVAQGFSSFKSSGRSQRQSMTDLDYQMCELLYPFSALSLAAVTELSHWCGNISASAPKEPPLQRHRHLHIIKGCATTETPLPYRTGDFLVDTTRMGTGLDLYIQARLLENVWFMCVLDNIRSAKNTVTGTCLIYFNIIKKPNL